MSFPYALTFLWTPLIQHWPKWPTWLTQRDNITTKYLSGSIFDLHKDSGEHFQIRNTLAEEKVCSQTIHKQTKSSVWGVHLLDNLFTMNYSANSSKGPIFFSSYIKIFSYDSHRHKCYLWLMLSLLSSFLFGP